MERDAANCASFSTTMFVLRVRLFLAAAACAVLYLLSAAATAQAAPPGHLSPTLVPANHPVSLYLDVDTLYKIPGMKEASDAAMEGDPMAALDWQAVSNVVFAITMPEVVGAEPGSLCVVHGKSSLAKFEEGMIGVGGWKPQPVENLKFLVDGKDGHALFSDDKSILIIATSPDKVKQSIAVANGDNLTKAPGYQVGGGLTSKTYCYIYYNGKAMSPELIAMVKAGIAQQGAAGLRQSIPDAALASATADMFTRLVGAAAVDFSAGVMASDPTKGICHTRIALGSEVDAEFVKQTADKLMAFVKKGNPMATIMLHGAKLERAGGTVTVTFLMPIDMLNTTMQHAMVGAIMGVQRQRIARDGMNVMQGGR